MKSGSREGVLIFTGTKLLPEKFQKFLTEFRESEAYTASGLEIDSGWNLWCHDEAVPNEIPVGLHRTRDIPVSYAGELHFAQTGDRESWLLGRFQDSPNFCEIETNLDNITGEQIGAAIRLLLDLGCVDVWSENIQMKKGRPAFRLSCLVPIDRREQILSQIFRIVPTLGVRAREVFRVHLLRKEIDGQKIFYLPNGERATKPEFDLVEERLRSAFL